MSYIVLARKYRPRNFTEMVGQDHVVQALSNALTTQRLHHAYLFTGTRGVGKTTVSRILAKSLNCQGVDGQGGITATPCGVCQACKDIDAGRFVDYTELDAASNRGVGEVQSLLEQAVYKPVQGRFKVFMIDEVHMLTNTAFNAMLKTLEEPPEYLKFVLATTDPQKVPVTVLSRCLQFNLRPMAPETIREHLEKVLPIEGVQADSQALRLLSRAARGSMRDALSLTDQAIAYGSGRLEEAAVRQMLGSVDRSYVFRLIDALAQGDGKTVVETSEALRLNGLSAGSTLEEMVMLLQRMAVVQAVPSLSEPDDSDPDAAEVIRLAACMPADETQLLYSLCLQGGAELGLAPDEYAALTMVLLRLLAFKPGGIRAAVGEKKTLNSAAPRRPELVPTPPAPSPASPSAPPSGGSDSLLPSRVQPWEDAAVHIEKVAEPRVSQGQVAPDFIAQLPAEPAMPLAQASASLAPKPVVHAVPVVEAPLAPPMLAARQAPERQAATPSMAAVPVRVQGDSRSDALSGRTGAPAVVPTPEGDFWHALVMEMAQRESITAFVRELALQSQLLARDADQWQLRVERESLNQPSARDRLTAALLAAGHAVRLVVEVGRVNDSPAKRNAVAAAERQLAAEKIIVDDPFVQAMMRDFGAKIVPGSIKPG